MGYQISAEAGYTRLYSYNAYSIKSIKYILKDRPRMMYSTLPM